MATPDLKPIELNNIHVKHHIRDHIKPNDREK